MKVQELIEELQKHDKDMEVQFGYELGDYYGTEVARSIKNIYWAEIKESGNSGFDEVVDSEKVGYDKNVILLSPYV